MKLSGEVSETRNQPGSGAQGANLGNQEFLSQTNNNADCVPAPDRFKFVDDLTTLEKINLLSVGLASHNTRLQVPSDVPTHGQIVDNQNLKTQSYIDSISSWTTNQKMVLNKIKTKAMIVNFTEKYQFSTRLNLNNKTVELVDSMKILGTIINKKLEWGQNCKELVKKVNKRMVFIRKILSFGANRSEMVHLWKTYCRSVLEQSAVLWQGALTEHNRATLERTQRTFVKLILGRKFESYQKSLQVLDLPTLDQRRNILCLNFAKKCIMNKKLSHLFPLNKRNTNCITRKKNIYQIQFANTERYRKSPIIHMQRLLNDDDDNMMSSLQPTG